ncbi:hypothetical protein [Paracoccus sp. (in: a-proteobacteria)]|uniref:hypothetical protein n=1 Tax=Paracoccus sp. TaxID=267 RepID=UPI003A8C064A
MRNTRARGNQAFEFSNKPAPHSVWFVERGDNILVRGDIDGDTIPDFAIMVMDVDALTARDFLL